jgi:hypothetical protein
VDLLFPGAGFWRCGNAGCVGRTLDGLDSAAEYSLMSRGIPDRSPLATEFFFKR